MSPRPQVLVRTIPPSTNANYGGILQAWALQRVLEDLGHLTAVDSTFSNRPRLARRLATTFKLRLVSTLLRILGGGPGHGAGWYALQAANRPLLDFSRRRIRMTALYSHGIEVRSAVTASASAFVVGSDQIWNPRYSDVSSFLLDFLPGDDPRPRIAYAASFGSESPAFDETLIRRSAPLARRFTAVSVREDSGVRLCEELWGVEAVRVIDPTMLLSPDAYRSLWESAGVRASGGTTAVYILDDDPAKRTVIDTVATALGTAQDELQAPQPRSFRDFTRDPAAFAKRSIERWLAGIAGSEAVLTDSYHGTVFAILFNRPFLVFPNAQRGMARFETLLRIFSLEGRVARGDGDDLDRMLDPIDWTSVNRRIGNERGRGIDFLATSLRGVPIER